MSIAEQEIMTPAPPAAALPEDKRQRSLRWSVLDASCYAGMVGFGETYFIPMMLFLGASTFHVGVFAAAPQLFFALSQFAGIGLIERFARRKSIILSGGSLQLACLLAMAAALAMGVRSPWVFILLAVGYFGFNGSTIPSWNSLLGDLTTDRDRGSYFGRRNGLSQLTMFGALVVAGLALERTGAVGHAGTGFLIILFAAAACRAGSLFCLSRHDEPEYRTDPNAYFSFRQFLRRGAKSNFGRFVFFVGFMNFAIQISAPYFAVYMIRDLKFDYMQFTVAQGVFIAVQFLSMRRWGAFSDIYGNRVVLMFTGIMLCFIPLLWFLTVDFYMILLLQVLAGLAWGGWFLSSANFIFDAVTPPRRARCAAYLNFFNSLGFFLGALLGAYLAGHAPHALDTGAMHVRFFSPLEFLFLISAGMRAMALLALLPSIHEVRNVDRAGARDALMMLINVRPLSGVRFAPFTGVSRKRARNGNGRRKRASS